MYAFAFFELFGIMASLLGIILGYSRQIYALSREGFLPKFLSKLTKKTQAPANASIAGGIFGIICIFSGKTDQLITLSVLGAIVMYIISMVSLFVLKRKFPDLPRPYQTPFYPFFPAVALILGIVCLVSVVYYNLVLAGIFLFAFLLSFGLYAMVKGVKE